MSGCLSAWYSPWPDTILTMGTGGPCHANIVRPVVVACCAYPSRAGSRFHRETTSRGQGPARSHAEQIAFEYSVNDVRAFNVTASLVLIAKALRLLLTGC
jgi:hypothetical protein